MAANLTNLNSKSIARLENKLDSLESKFTVLSSLNSKLSVLEDKLQISDIDSKTNVFRGLILLSTVQCLILLERLLITEFKT